MILDIESKWNNIRISYFDKDGNVKLKDYRVNDIENWTVCSETDKNKSTDYRNWDNKPVKKAKDRYLNKWSMYEFIQNSEDLEELSALNFPKIYSIDIETEVIDGFPNPDIARERITTIAIATQDKKVMVLGWKPITKEQEKQIYDNTKNHLKAFGDWEFKYVNFDDEYNMLYTYIHRLLPTMAFVTGWNYIGFDWKYIYNRCRKLGIDPAQASPSKKVNRDNIPLHIAMMDYLDIYRRFDRTVAVKENNTLDFVSQTVLGAQKIKYNGTLQELYEQDYDKYVFYNAVDAALVVEIHEKIATLNAVLSVSVLCNISLYKSVSAVNITEAFLWKKYYERGFVVGDQFIRPGERQGYEGAYVKEPQTGFYKGAACFDFASLYPSIMRQINISPESFIKKETNQEKLAELRKDKTKIVSVTGAVYHKEDSAMKDILTELYSKRKVHKQKHLKLEVEIQKLKKQLK
jgi:DNA polymerase elongation subunit (family B)